MPGFDFNSISDFRSELLAHFPGCSVTVGFSEAFPSIGSAGIEVAFHALTDEGLEAMTTFLEARGASWSDWYGDTPQRHMEVTIDGIRLIGFHRAAHAA